MNLKIYIELHEPLVLPIAHHHVLEGLIYKQLSLIPDFSFFLHNVGYENEKKSFKLFTFSPLKGHYRVINKQIVFDDTVEWEIRSFDPTFIHILARNMIKNRRVHLNGTELVINDLDIAVLSFHPNRCQIRAVSPVVVYKSYAEGGISKTKYFSPREGEFASLINSNFKEKYFAATGIRDVEDISIAAVKVDNKDKYVTMYKNETYITGWKGQYYIEGDSLSLQFLYDTGLGSKNSEGFGMFDYI